MFPLILLIFVFISRLFLYPMVIMCIHCVALGNLLYLKSIWNIHLFSKPIMEEEEEYKQQANALKEQGNAAFQAGDVTLAINYFSQAIEIDPDNHVLYSNRSAAYMKADSKSKALHDAERCVELAPNWAKGYNRLGVAQQSLKRFTAAMDSLKKGVIYFIYSL